MNRAEQKTDICSFEQAHRLVYRNGIVRCFNQLYRHECLKNYTGTRVTLIYDPTRMLEMRAYTCPGDEQPSGFLGYVKMLHLEELGLSEAQLASGQVSLAELKAIVANSRVQSDTIGPRRFKLSTDRSDLIGN